MGENIGAGDVDAFEDEARWQRAGMATPFVERLPKKFHTMQLGKWFKGGQELSIGQWQKIALPRAFMREDDADLFVLDEYGGGESDPFRTFDEDVRSAVSGERLKPASVFASFRFEVRALLSLCDGVAGLSPGLCSVGWDCSEAQSRVLAS